MKLPIPITAIPDPIASPEIWKQIERSLSQIADREQNNENLFPNERIAYNAIAYARYQAVKKQWRSLWQYLLDRQLVEIGEIVAPPPKKPRNPTRPTNPPKAKKPKRKKKRDRPKIMRFARLKPSLIRLRVFLWWCWYVGYSEVSCRAKSPLRNRPDGDRIKAILTRRASNGDYYSLHLYMPSTQGYCKMNPDVLDILLKWSNPLRPRSEKKIESDKAKGDAARLISAQEFAQVLTDKWQDTAAITAKLNLLLGTNYPLDLVSKLLGDRFRKGEVFRHKLRTQCYYSNTEATEFEGEWIDRERAYAIAVSRGCKAAENTFRKTYKFDYAAFGLEFRKDVPATESSRLRWRDVNP
jgi:hypothetical protein